MTRRYPFLKQAENRESFFRRIELLYPTRDPRHQMILRAYNASKDAFRGLSREDGERYFEHLRGVSLIMTDHLRVRDHRLITEGLLHDIVEDKPEWTVNRVAQEFGDDVALMVDWLSKGDINNFGGSKEARDQAYHYRFAYAPRDFFLVKLPDRWYNLLTLGACPADKRARKIEETRRYYLPYAEKHCILIHELEEAIRAIEKIKK